MVEGLTVELENKDMHDFLDTLLGGDLAERRFCVVEGLGIAF